jgi:NAD+ kinase
MKLGVVANTAKPDAETALARLAAGARARGFELVVRAGDAAGLDHAEVRTPDTFAHGLDALLALGGDGTLLHAVRLLAGADVPLLGVNLGSLGFMTSVPLDRLEDALDALRAGNYRVSTRTMLACRLLRGDAALGDYRALNDVVIGWGEASRVVTLRVTIDGEEVGDYDCDGLICSTPTGSTGHSLSGGGPVVQPEAPVFLINPICPHTLSIRPLVVPDASRITLDVQRSAKRQLLVIDGQDRHAMEQGDRVIVTRATPGARFVHLADYRYFALLRQKLHWRGSSVH